jgi:hypothetical protein
MRDRFDYNHQDWQIIKDYSALLTSAMRMMLPPCANDITISEKFATQFLKLSNDISNIIARNKVRPALGHHGPELSDTFIHGLVNSGKIILADQSLWLNSHSGMKMPSPDFIKHVYQEFIINKQKGIKNFGRYN